MADQGLSPVIFEKSRGLGGWLATRRADGGMAFDHGAQFVTVRSQAFREFVDSAERSAAAACWSPRVAGKAPNEERAWYVGAPTMNALVKPLAEGIDVRFKVQVSAIERAGGAWCLRSLEDPAGNIFDAVVSTVPAPQACALLGTESAFAEALDQVTIDPCWALMLAFDQFFDPGFDIRRADRDDLALIARITSKPGRGAVPDCWVAHASPAWSKENLEQTTQHASERMTAMLAEALNCGLPRPRHVAAHRWRYAQTRQPLGKPYLCNDAQTLFAGGDWCLGGRVEFGFESGQAMATALLSACKT